ncbi:b9978c4c-4ee7-40bf-a745-39ed5f7c5dcf [Thermothielavioides terrestris]|uniref:B9978c4c-4ee7-40bf-a745-39ed5f7c5dcf n=1 Tax=Thermothielavioides terrestris TaxID=2587410 RepID=A0A446B838_9PEZI|nr:b9978c4c-4ee7-40bf-a745-39ed5f7c5dcf [Thermothielavioides terrestris]
MNELFLRQSSCLPNFDQCKDANFPPYFCCPSGQTCNALAGNTTVLCCPNGANCQRIEPLPCDISLQDGQKYPDAVVKTTALGGTLEPCGGQCCPFGYSCSANNQCVMNKDQSQPPAQTTTATPQPTSTDGAGSNPTTGSTGASGASAGQASGSSSGPPVAAIAGGVTAGVVALIAAALIAFILYRRRKAREMNSPPKLSRSTSSFGNLISNPIIVEHTTLRTDFARARDSGADPGSVTGAFLNSSANSPDSGAMPAVPAAAAQRPRRQSSVAYGYGGLEPAPFEPSPFDEAQYFDHDGRTMPQTPRQEHREPSSVSINVFADPNDPNMTPDRTPESNTDRRYSNMTTFTQMLGRAGLDGVARGESYVPPQPGYGQGSPTARR